MRHRIGDRVKHPSMDKEGEILEIKTNPACLLRQFVVQWADGEEEELEELDFGPLED